MLQHPPQGCGYPGFNDLTCNSLLRFLILETSWSATSTIFRSTYNSTIPTIAFQAGFWPWISRLLLLWVVFTRISSTFLGCRPSLYRSQHLEIDCLNNEAVSVIASSSMAFLRATMNACNVIAAAMPRPGSRSFQNNGKGFSSDLTCGDLFLSSAMVVFVGIL